MRCKQNTTRIKSWEKKWNKFSNKTQTYLTKSRKNTKPLQKNSRRTQLWLWLRGQSPPTCLSNTAKMVKINQTQTICLHGENHSSAERITQQSTSTNPECPDHQDRAKQPRRKQLRSGSYEIWQLHHSRFRQSARWERCSTSSQTQPRKMNKLESSKKNKDREPFSKKKE